MTNTNIKNSTVTIQREPIDRVNKEVKSITQWLKALQKHTLRDDYPTQRYSEYWEKQKQYDLISTILHGYPIPDIIVAEQMNDDGTYWTWLLDGLQRLSTFAMYKNNAFKCGKNTDNPVVKYQVVITEEKGQSYTENRECDIRGKYYKQLPAELKERFDEFNITAVKYLNCETEDIEYHIRRYNNSRAMTAAQKGLTYLGSNFARVAKKMTQMPFFRDKGNYTLASFKNGAMERVILESVMTSFFIDDWQKKPNDMCSFLQENAKITHFDELESYIERLDEIVDSKDQIPMFNATETLLFMPLFKKFSRLGIDDERFMEFLTEFNTNLRDKEIDGCSYESIKTEGGTKDKNVIIHKIEHLTKLMNEYFGIANTDNTEESSDLKINNSKIKDFVTDFSGREIIAIHTDRQKEKNYVAIKTLMELERLPWDEGDKDDGENKTSQEFINELSDKDPEFIEQLIYDADMYTDCLEAWTANIDNNSPIFHKDNLPILVHIAEYAYQLTLDDDVIEDWITHFASQYQGDKPLNYKILEESLDRYCEYLEEKFSKVTEAK